MELTEASNIAKQLAFEMNISHLWWKLRRTLKGAKEQRELMLRANGAFGSDLD